MADTQSLTRQKSSSGSQRQTNYPGNSSNMNAGNDYNNMNQYNTPPPPSDYNTYSGNATNYPMNNNTGGGSLKRKKFRFERVRK
jgi:hypothetical protein